MSFLTPFYIAGFLAVSLPVLLHMIRRVPHRPVPFSTVMFMEPSPPRVARRRQIENWLLLALRVLALCLLALAFARPFLRNNSEIDANQEPRRGLAVLLDTSASMRRGRLWPQAIAKAKALLDETTPRDRISLLGFDRDVETLLSFDEWTSTPPSARRPLVAGRLDQIAPGWFGTDLGKALAAACDALLHEADRDARKQTFDKHVILISDLQNGSRLDELEGYPWPDDVTLRIERVAPNDATNAGLQLVAQGIEEGWNASDERLRVRVSNAAGSSIEQFRIHWESVNVSDRSQNTNGIHDVGNSSFNPKPNGLGVAARAVGPADKRLGPISAPDGTQTVHLFVPAGQSRVVRAPPLPPGSVRLQLILEGDAHRFDNVLYVCPPASETLTVLYVGAEAPDDPEQPRYYFERAFPETNRRRVQIVGAEAMSLALSTLTEDIDLIVVTDKLGNEHLGVIRQYVRQGGTLLCLAKDDAMITVFESLLEVPSLHGEEAQGDGYAMLTDLDFSHPVLSPLADVRFADFTKLHVWKHRIVHLDAVKDPRVLARFDDGSPAWIEFRYGHGKTFLFLTGWHPEDSQFALSSKFVPILNGILNYATGRAELPIHYTVGDPIPVSVFQSASNNLLTIQVPGQDPVPLTQDKASFTDTQRPGIYTVAFSDRRVDCAVNLDAHESKTGAMSFDRLKAFGIRVTSTSQFVPSDHDNKLERQMSNRELEGQQHVWRWLILAAFVVLIAETWLARRTAARTFQTEQEYL